MVRLYRAISSPFMSLVVLDGVTLFFGDRLIFDNISLRLGHGDRLGLIGPNGSGKTTLLKVIAGEQEIDDGTVTRANGVRVGWLPQDIAVEGGRTLIDMILSSVPGRKALDERLAEIEVVLEQATKDGAPEDELLELAAEVGELHERIDHFDRFFGEHEAHAILAGLGFSPRDAGRDLGELSGGWKMRGVLAGLLFQRPDVLLLDEPTNHLDLPSVAWFGEFLKRWNRCFLLISHDREFLNDQIARVVSLELEGVRTYTGNYDKYVEQRAEEETILAGRAKNLAREKERLTRFIDRFRAQANKAKAVQSRIKALERMDDVETLGQRGTLRFSFPETSRTVADVVRIEGLKKSYGAHAVFPDGVDLTVRRGEKIGIIGVNGAGKTTLLRMIAGEIPHDAGTIKIGSGVQVGYYAQHHADTLEMSATIYEIVQRAAPDTAPARVRSICGAFMFSGDDIDKPAKVLSGGERARVALAKLCVAPGNLLLMDEPTNHLDLASSEALAGSLATFDGTLVFVSHNRSLIRKLATRIWNVEDGKVETYPGTLDEYMYSMAQRRAEISDGSNRKSGAVGGGKASSAPAATAAAKISAADEKARKRREAEQRQKRAATLGPLEKQVAQLEERIGVLESEQKVRSAELADPTVYDDAARRNKLLADYQGAQDKLDELTARWETTMAKLEAAKAELGDAS
jgi:ATP-binding cassette, subfamily F, member 3